jgi:pimeloyl-ACP methyl ester carboxylesterase
LNSSGEAGGKNIDIGIIALEIMPVSSRITHPALRKDVMVHEIQAIIKHHGWSRFVLVSHSYGSIIATHLLKSTLTAPMIGPIVFIDPVSFLLHLPDVAYNFTSRQPMRANEHLLWYFGSKDMGVAHALARGFFWTENIVWTEDLRVKTGNDAKGRNVTVVLGGRDLIVDAEAVKRYLTASSLETLVVNGKAAWTTKNGDATSITTTREDIKAWKGGPWTGSGLEILYFDHLDHGQVFDVEQTRRPVIEAIRLYSATG